MNEDTCENNIADNGNDNVETCEGIALEEVSADFKDDSAKETTEGDLRQETTNCKLKYESELEVDNQAFVPEDDMKTTEQSPDSNDSAEVSVINTKNSKRSSSGSESIDAKSIASSSAGKSSTTTLGPLDSAEEGPPAYSSSSTGKSFTTTLENLGYTKEGASAYASTDSELGCPVEAAGDGHQESMFFFLC